MSVMTALPWFALLALGADFETPGLLKIQAVIDGKAATESCRLFR